MMPPDTKPVAPAGSATLRPPVFLAPAARAAAFGQPDLAWPDLGVFTLSEARLAGAACVSLDSPGGYRPVGGGEVLALPRPVARHLQKPCLLLKTEAAEDGRAVLEQAGLLALLVRSGAWRGTHVVVGVGAAPLRAAIAAILPDAVVLEHPDDEVWQFKRLSGVADGGVSLPALEALRDAMLAGPAAPADAPRRLLVGAEVLDNAEPVIATAQLRGFVTVAIATMEPRAQAALFAGADAIVGVRGAAMANVAFVPAGCAVMVISPEEAADPWPWEAACVRDVSYGEMFAERREGAVHADLDTLRAMMDAVLAERADAAVGVPTLQERVDLVDTTAPPPPAPRLGVWARWRRRLIWVWNGMLDDHEDCGTMEHD